MKPLIRVTLAAFVGVLSFWSVSDAEARVLVGVRAGEYTEIDEPYVGGELIAAISHHFYFNPNVEYVFVEHGKFGTGNLDFHVDLPVADALHLWLGAGLAVLYSDPEGPPESDTELGLNLLVGAGVQVGAVIPYAQAKLLVVNDEEELVWAIGIRF